MPNDKPLVAMAMINCWLSSQDADELDVEELDVDVVVVMDVFGSSGWSAESSLPRVGTYGGGPG